MVALSGDGKVDHHDPVLLHETDQHDDADKRVQAQFGSKQQQRQQGAESGCRQARENRQRVREAFIQDPEHDVDDDDRHQQYQAEASHRILECLRGALKHRRNRRRQRRRGGRLDGRHCVAEGHAGLQVE